MAPGSYFNYIRERRPPSRYPDTVWQRAIADAGRDAGKACRGKTGSEFYECRADVLRMHFPRGARPPSQAEKEKDRAASRTFYRKRREAEQYRL